MLYYMIIVCAYWYTVDGSIRIKENKSTGIFHLIWLIDVSEKKGAPPPSWPLRQHLSGVSRNVHISDLKG